jgi:hypothetical protein
MSLVLNCVIQFSNDQFSVVFNLLMAKYSLTSHSLSSIEIENVNNFDVWALM